jgi:hypothetical protein
MDKQVASKLIGDKLSLMAALMRECEVIAEDSGVVFDLPWGGEGTDQRGMGATYVPTTADEETKQNNVGVYAYRNDGWMSSAGQC